MKAFFYIWCAMAVTSLVACFFNPGHIFFSFLPSVAMAVITYPETHQGKEQQYEK